MECIFGDKTKAFKENVKFIVDPDDYDKFCKDYRFSLNKGYVRYSSAKDGLHNKFLHRIIMNVVDPKVFIDHIDGNPLNNQRSNLRECTQNQNQHNRTKNKNNKSGFKGVHFVKNKNKYRAVIRANNKQINLGYFDIAEDAFEAYKKGAVKYHGEFAKF